MSKRLAVEGPKELLAITINGQVFVESEEERKPLDIRFREYFRALRQAYKTSKKVSTLVIFQLFLAWKLRVRRAC